MGFWAQNTSGEVAAVHMPKSKRIMWGGGGPGCPGQAEAQTSLAGPQTPLGQDSNREGPGSDPFRLKVQALSLHF